jgi:hypothetical protein
MLPLHLPVDHRLPVYAVNLDQTEIPGSQVRQPYRITFMSVYTIFFIDATEKQAFFSIMDAFIGKKKLKDALSNVLKDVM